MACKMDHSNISESLVQLIKDTPEAEREAGLTALISFFDTHKSNLNNTLNDTYRQIHEYFEPLENHLEETALFSKNENAIITRIRRFVVNCAARLLIRRNMDDYLLEQISKYDRKSSSFKSHSERFEKAYSTLENLISSKEISISSECTEKLEELMRIFGEISELERRLSRASDHIKNVYLKVYETFYGKK
ncbi:MAG: hypothetical protein QXW00_02070 [Candidatus Woesearchaeota archaeon]